MTCFCDHSSDGSCLAVAELSDEPLYPCCCSTLTLEPSVHYLMPMSQIRLPPLLCHSIPALIWQLTLMLMKMQGPEASQSFPWPTTAMSGAMSVWKKARGPHLCSPIPTSCSAKSMCCPAISAMDCQSWRFWHLLHSASPNCFWQAVPDSLATCASGCCAWLSLLQGSASGSSLTRSAWRAAALVTASDSTNKGAEPTEGENY